MEPSSVMSRQRENYFIKPCPLCNGNVRRYCLINFTEKLVMCENVYCDYPFGYEYLEFSPLEFEANMDAARSILAEHNEFESSVTSSSVLSDIYKFNKLFQSEESQLLSLDGSPKNSKRKSKFDFISNKKIRKELEDLEYQITKLNEMGKGAEHNGSTSISATSSSASSNIDKFNKIFQSEESELLSLDVPSKDSSEAKSKSDFIIEKLTKNIEDLKNLTNELNEIKPIKTGKTDVIKNQKWLEKLMKLQGSSGIKLLKKEEMKLLEEKTPARDGDGLNIDSNKNNMSSINIQIVNADCNRNTSKDVFKT